MAVGKLYECCRQYVDLTEDKMKELTEAFVAVSITSDADMEKRCEALSFIVESKGSLL